MPQLLLSEVEDLIVQEERIAIERSLADISDCCVEVILLLDAAGLLAGL